MDLYSKGGKLRRIYFPESLCMEMLFWLELQGKDSGFIFVNRKGQQITSRGISSQLKVLAVHYHISPDTVYPHSFRHRFAKNFLGKFNDCLLYTSGLHSTIIRTAEVVDCLTTSCLIKCKEVFVINTNGIVEIILIIKMCIRDRAS